MYIETTKHKLRLYPAAIVMTSLFGSVVSPIYTDAFDAPKKQTFLVTAYYSPLPDQCCYARGGYEEDIVFNGEGIRGADGTGVYPGMIAAPPTYPFGTVIELPSINVIGTVHDRGGRIVEWNTDIHRIDLWMGYGEEGLARAMTWGARTVEGIVHPAHVAPTERFRLEEFEADKSMIAMLATPSVSFLIPEVEEGYTTNGVRRLQEALAELGLLTARPNAHFGPSTRAALQTFLREYDLEGDGSSLSTEASAALSAARTIKEENLPILAEGLSIGMAGDEVRQAKKLLRYLGFYAGRTDDAFDDSLQRAVLSFQIAHGVVPSESTPGAGRIGPSTRAGILKAWKKKVVLMKAEKLAKEEEVRTLALRTSVPSTHLSRGDRGEEVRKLQNFLISQHYLPASDNTGHFGSRTEAALMAYQMDREIIDGKSERGAGIFGPMTMRVVTDHITDVAWETVRAGL